MSYVIYNKETTVQFYIRARSVGCYTDTWATEGAAKATLTREAKKNPEFNRDDYAIAEISDFRKNIEKQVTKSFIHPHTSEKCEVTQPINTPRCCDPSSELYWTM
jgi:hypothetical protein